MAEIAKVELDNKNKLSTPKSAADFLKEFDSPWTGLARSRRLSVGTQDTIRLLRTHTRETFDQVTSKSMEEALDSLDLDAKEVSDESVFGNIDDNKNTNRKNKKNEKNINDSGTNNIAKAAVFNDMAHGKIRPSIQLGARLRNEIQENYDMLQSLPTVKHAIRKVTRFNMEKLRTIFLKPDGISVCKFKKKEESLEETTFVPYESISEALLIDHTSILIQVTDYHDLQWKSSMAPHILSDIAVRLEIVNLLSQKREQLHTIESVAKHMYRWGVIDSKVLKKSNIELDDDNVYGMRKHLAVKKSRKSIKPSSNNDADNNPKEKASSFYFFKRRRNSKRKQSNVKSSLSNTVDEDEDGDNNNDGDDDVKNCTNNSNIDGKNNTVYSVPKPRLSNNRRHSKQMMRREKSNQKVNKDKTRAYRKSMVERMVSNMKDPVESQVTFYVQKLVYDQETDEGRTRIHFIDNSTTMFENSNNNNKEKDSLMIVNSSEHLLAPLKKTRQFIDGMREYIMEHHEDNLLKLLDESLHSSTSAISNIVGGKELEDVEEEVADEREVRVLRLEGIVTKCAEQSIVKNLFPLILKNIADIITKEETARWLEQYSKLSLKSQAFFEIPSDHQCDMDWYEASLACADIGLSKTASEKMEALLDTARLIYERFHELKPKTVLGADDFMPIFMFVISRGRLDRAFYDKEYLVHLCPANVLDGEGAYYLSTFEAALSFMIDMKL